jgi:hypothetical protein
MFAKPLHCSASHRAEPEELGRDFRPRGEVVAQAFGACATLA